MQFNMVFSDLSVGLRKVASAVQEIISNSTGSPQGKYSCLHVRNGDKEDIEGPTQAWIEKNLDDSDGLPLYLMTQSAYGKVQKLAKCGDKRKCIKSTDILPSDSEAKNLGSNKRLFVELAVCAMAKNV